MWPPKLTIQDHILNIYCTQLACVFHVFNLYKISHTLDIVYFFQSLYAIMTHLRTALAHSSIMYTYAIGRWNAIRQSQFSYTNSVILSSPRYINVGWYNFRLLVSKLILYSVGFLCGSGYSFNLHIYKYRIISELPIILLLKSSHTDMTDSQDRPQHTFGSLTDIANASSNEVTWVLPSFRNSALLI